MRRPGPRQSCDRRGRAWCGGGGLHSTVAVRIFMCSVSVRAWHSDKGVFRGEGRYPSIIWVYIWSYLDGTVVAHDGPAHIYI